MAFILNVMLKLKNINCYLQTSEINSPVMNFLPVVGHWKSCPLSVTLLLKHLGGSHGEMVVLWLV